MGRQQSVVQLTGSVGNLTFYKTKDGFLARQRGGGVSKARMNSDPRFARTLENLSEFGRANTASKLLRIALRNFLVKRADRNMTRRLSSSLMEVLKSDPANNRGQRLVEKGDFTKLKDFEFNENGKVLASVFAPFTTSIDRATGALTLDMPPFQPLKMVVHPEGATHFRLKIAGTSLDIPENSYLTSVVETPDIDVFAPQQDAIQLVSQLPAGLQTPLLLTLGTEYFQSVNGKMYPLENGAFNGIVIVDVNQVAG